MGPATLSTAIIGSLRVFSKLDTYGSLSQIGDILNNRCSEPRSRRITMCLRPTIVPRHLGHDRHAPITLARAQYQFYSPFCGSQFTLSADHRLFGLVKCERNHLMSGVAATSRVHPERRFIVANDSQRAIHPLITRGKGSSLAKVECD